MRVLIIGGGIGGLAVANAIRHRGIEDVRVFERQPQIRAVGAGIAITANSMMALQDMGLRGRLESVATVLQDSTVRSFRGTTLSRFPMAKVGQHFNTSSISLHRADLLATLEKALPTDSIRLDAKLVGCETVGDEVQVHFADGSSATGDLLIAADGLESAVRKQHWPNNPKHYCGYLCWRGLTAEPFEHAAMPTGLLIEMWGHGVRMGASHIASGRAHWWVAANLPEHMERPAEGWQAGLLQRLEDWAAPARELVSATPNDAFLCMPIYDRRPESSWIRDRIVLLGDAAHPMAPDLGQGANMAIEDGYVLAKQLSEGGDLQSNLLRYQKTRRPRASKIQRLSRLWGAVGQWSSVAACEARNFGMRMWPDFVQRQGFTSLMQWSR